MAVRSITGIVLPSVVPATLAPDLPEVTWIAPGDLLVDETYQRSIAEKGQKLIRRIVENFEWRKFKPPTVVWTDAGLEVIDGQHSAIAAATHPGIASIPVFVVDAAAIADRAAAFVGINHDRLNVTPMQLHAAAIVAGNEDALRVADACKSADIRILRAPPTHNTYLSRDTVAIQSLHMLVRGRGVEGAQKVLQVLADADLAPVTAAAIKAAEYLMFSPEHADAFEPADLTKAIVALGSQADRDAGVFAAEKCVPRWRGLAAVWFKKTKKRKPSVEPPQIVKDEVKAVLPMKPPPPPKPETRVIQPIKPVSRVSSAAHAMAEMVKPGGVKDRHYRPFKDGTYSQ